MLKFIVEKWYKNKDRLKREFETNEKLYKCDYLGIVQTVFDIIVNDDDSQKRWFNFNENNKLLDTSHITEINDGKGIGTLIYLIPFNVSPGSPNEAEYLMTYINYGSCEICDLLASIQNGGKYFTEEQVEDFMYLSLHILQHTIKPYNKGYHFDKRFEPSTHRRVKREK